MFSNSLEAVLTKKQTFLLCLFSHSLALQVLKTIAFFSARRLIRSLKCNGDQVRSRVMQGVQEIIALVPFIMLLIEIILFAFYFKLDKRQRFIIFPMKDKI